MHAAGGYVESDFVLDNSRLWQAIYTQETFLSIFYSSILTTFVALLILNYTVKIKMFLNKGD